MTEQKPKPSGTPEFDSDSANEGRSSDCVDEADLFSLGLIEDFDSLSPEAQSSLIERARYWMNRPPDGEEDEVVAEGGRELEWSGSR